MSRSKSGFKIVEVSARSCYASNSSSSTWRQSLASKTTAVSVSVRVVNRSSEHPASRHRRPLTWPLAAGRWQWRRNLELARLFRHHPTSTWRRRATASAATSGRGPANRGRSVNHRTTGWLIATGHRLTETCVTGTLLRWPSSMPDVQVITISRRTSSGTMDRAALTTGGDTSIGTLRCSNRNMLAPRTCHSSPSPPPPDTIRHLLVDSNCPFPNVTTTVANRMQRTKESSAYYSTLNSYRIVSYYIVLA